MAGNAQVLLKKTNSPFIMVNLTLTFDLASARVFSTVTFVTYFSCHKTIQISACDADVMKICFFLLEGCIRIVLCIFFFFFFW